MNPQASVTRSALVSHPDFRLLVRSAAEDNHETNLVVPTLPTSSVRYARMLVDEGAQFREHAVAFIDAATPDLVETVTQALTAARPTRVSFVRSSEVAEILAYAEQLSHTPHIAACAASIVERSRLNGQAAADRAGVTIISFVKGHFVGSVRVQNAGRMFDVSW